MTTHEGTINISVIIPCYNAETTIAATLESLARQHWDQPWEVLVVDNRSTDRSLTIAAGYRERLPSLRLIDASARQGQPFALNVGVAAARGAKILLCDADDEVGPGWLQAMGAALSEHEFVAARIDNEKLNSGWVRQSRGNNQRDGLQPYRYPPFLPHASSGSLGFSRELYERIGGFDESLLYLHDTDFCWRAQLAGVELHFVADAVVHMRYRTTMRALWRQAYNYAIDNVLLYKRYRSKGMPPISPGMSLRAWWQLARRVVKVRGRGSLAICLWYGAQRLGRLRGSLKYRVFAL